MISPSPREVVEGFFSEVRSGRRPEAAERYFAAEVLAHQLEIEQPRTVRRTPADYAAHVREMQAAFGAFTLEVTECLAEGDRVYVRWVQRGRHVGEIDGFAPTGAELSEGASAVYRVEADRIAEYWIQIDRAGLRHQLEAPARRH